MVRRVLHFLAEGNVTPVTLRRLRQAIVPIGGGKDNNK
jgi:hypothetical protein